MREVSVDGGRFLVVTSVFSLFEEKYSSEVNVLDPGCSVLFSREEAKSLGLLENGRGSGDVAGGFVSPRCFSMLSVSR